MLFMVIERFRDHDGAAVYRRFREKGRMLPAGLKYVDSWVEVNGNRCFQLMECDDIPLFQQWVARWNDLVDFEIVAVRTSQEAAARHESDGNGPEEHLPRTAIGEAGPGAKGRGAMAEFQKVMPVLKVSDMERSVAFYTGVLGFTVAWRAANDGGGENCMLQAGAAELLLSTGSHLGGKPQFTGTLYFHMDCVEAFYDRIKETVKVVWPLEVMDYGQKEFGIRDKDGYMLAFAEEV